MWAKWCQAEYSRTRAGTFEVGTDATGRYRFDGLPDGSWTVKAFKLDYVVTNPERANHEVALGTTRHRA